MAATFVHSALCLTSRSCLFEREFTTQSDRMLQLSISHICLFLKSIQQLLKSSSSPSHHFYPCLYLSFIRRFRTPFLRRMLTIQLAFLNSYCFQDIPFLLDSMQCFAFHTIGPMDLLCLYPAPHFKTIQIFFIYFPQRITFNTIKTML